MAVSGAFGAVTVFGKGAEKLRLPHYGLKQPRHRTNEWAEGPEAALAEVCGPDLSGEPTEPCLTATSHWF